MLELGHIFLGPYAGFLLAHAGAEVIKIEPLAGEHLRNRTAAAGSGIAFQILNTNKRSLAISLKHQEGRDLLLDLVRESDVLIENFAAETMPGFGLGADRLLQENPRLIYASGSGYGRTGPYRSYPAMDLVVQAMSGVIACTGFPDTPPVKAGVAICDFTGGLAMYAAITTALIHRGVTGTGTKIDISMLESVYPHLMSSIGPATLDEPPEITRMGNRHQGLALAPYNVYPALDGDVAILVARDQQWALLTAEMQAAGIEVDPSFHTLGGRLADLDALDALVASWTSRYSKEEVAKRLRKIGVPVGPVRTMREVIYDAHLEERGMVCDLPTPDAGVIRAMRSPLRAENWPLLDLRPAPQLGADSKAILGEVLGLETARIAELQSNGVI